MIILGIDPGYAIVGYGIVNFNLNNYNYIESGAVITNPKETISGRLEKIFDNIVDLISFHKPDVISVESIYFKNNQKTAIKVAEARGVILLAAKKSSIPIYEYTPLQVKSAVTGYGKAEKYQVMMMTKKLLHLNNVPKPDDVADALAIAICHANYSNIFRLGGE